MAPLLPTTTSPRLPPSPAPKRAVIIKIATAAAAAAVAAATVSFTLTAKSAGWAPLVHSAFSTPLFADIAVIFARTNYVDPRIHGAFVPASSSDDHLLHVGLVNKEGFFGRPSKDYYAFGVYADGNDLKQQLKEYRNSSVSELKGNAKLMNDVLERDIRMTIRLMTVEGGLSIRKIVSKTSKLLEGGLPKLVEQEQLQRYFSPLLKDEYKLSNQSMIDLSRKQSHVLKISIDGNEVGSIQSKLLWKSIFDLYVGEKALDKKAKDIIQEEVARLLMRGWD